MKLWTKIRALFSKGRLEREMADEMSAHLDGLTERNIAKGMSCEDARYAALRAFGGVEQIKERAREARSWVWLEQLVQDVRYAVRSLVRSPSFTITAVLTLALGIGVNAALFSLFDKIALQQLPVKDPERLVRIDGRNRRGSNNRGFSHAEYLTYHDGSRTLEDILAFAETRRSFWREAGTKPDPNFDNRGLETVNVEFVSENYFSMLGGTMQLGRAFLPEEVRSTGAAPVIVLDHHFWKSRLDSDPNVVGTTLRLGHEVFTVVGVASAEFLGPGPLPLAGWMPLTMWSSRPTDYGPDGPPAFKLIGRLKTGISEAQAKAELDAISSRWVARIHGEVARTSVRLRAGLPFLPILPISAQTLAQLSPLFLGFGMVLIIACTNVANLLFARGVSRQSEIGVRMTLGAGRGRIVRQLLTENGLLCLLGAVVGLGLGIATLQVLEQIVLAPHLPATFMAFLKPVPDLRILGLTALLTVGATLVAGLLPALHTARASLIAAMHNQGSAFGRHLTASRLRQFLVIVQVALCLSLLSCAGVLARNFFTQRKLDVGFDAQAVFAVTMSPNTSIADRNTAFRQGLETVQAIPGVAATGMANLAPHPGRAVPARIRAIESATSEAEEVQAPFVTVGFFDTFGIPLLRGRAFHELDLLPTSHVIVVSESLARELWPGQEAVGRTLAVSKEPEEAFLEYEVIGVARDIALQIDDDDRGLLYLPLTINSLAQASMFVRPRSDSVTALLEIVRVAEARGVGLKFDYRLSHWLELKAQGLYSLALLSGVLGALALAMASVGLYGLMTFVVNQRVREIGIRVALGATAENVVGLIVRQGMRLVMIGLAFGLVGGWLCALLLNAMLYGFVDAFDPLAFGAVTLLFAAITLFASWLPARRATKVDPMVALRCE